MTTSTDPQYEKPRNEAFDVVMLKLTANEMMARPGDFKRLAVLAPDSLSARWLPEVAALEKEYRCIGAVPPGFQTEPEAMAQQREYTGGVTDRANVGLTHHDYVPPLKSNDPTK